MVEGVIFIVVYIVLAVQEDEETATTISYPQRPDVANML